MSSPIPPIGTRPRTSVVPNQPLIQRGNAVYSGSNIVGSFQTPMEASQFLNNSLVKPNAPGVNQYMDNTQTQAKQIPNASKGDMGLPYTNYRDALGVIESPASSAISSTRSIRMDRQITQNGAQKLLDMINSGLTN